MECCGTLQLPSPLSSPLLPRSLARPLPCTNLTDDGLDFYSYRLIARRKLVQRLSRRAARRARPSVTSFAASFNSLPIAPKSCESSKRHARRLRRPRKGLGRMAMSLTLLPSFLPSVFLPSLAQVACWPAGWLAGPGHGGADGRRRAEHSLMPDSGACAYTGGTDTLLKDIQLRSIPAHPAPVHISVLRLMNGHAVDGTLCPTRAQLFLRAPHYHHHHHPYCPCR